MASRQRCARWMGASELNADPFICTESDSSAPSLDSGSPPIPCNYLRVQIMENHLNGKDTHVRGLRVFGLQG